MESYPTGCAAALIDGTTHCRCNSIPVGKSFQKCPFNLKGSNTTKYSFLIMKTALVKTCVMDEHILAGRSYWALLQHRSKELRQLSSILDENGQLLYSETSILHEEYHQRPLGGVPLFIFFWWLCSVASGFAEANVWQVCWKSAHSRRNGNNYS